MKAYTDISQSKGLAKILPLESADMYWFVPADKEGEFIEEIRIITNKGEYYLFEGITNWNDTPYIPAWSLATLIELLPRYVEIDKNVTYAVEYSNQNDKIDFSFDSQNLIDACVAMIEKLHEQKLL